MAWLKRENGEEAQPRGIEVEPLLHGETHGVPPTFMGEDKENPGCSLQSNPGWQKQALGYARIRVLSLLPRRWADRASSARPPSSGSG